jgi:hypothetical protein
VLAASDETQICGFVVQAGSSRGLPAGEPNNEEVLNISATDRQSRLSALTGAFFSKKYPRQAQAHAVKT